MGLHMSDRFPSEKHHRQSALTILEVRYAEDRSLNLSASALGDAACDFASRNLWLFMSLPAFFFERVTADIRQQMDGVLALTDQLSRQRLTPDVQACVSGVEEAASGVRRMLDAALDLRNVAVQGLTTDPQPLRLRELIDEVHSRWQPQAAMSGVTLLVSYDGDPDVCAVADRQRLLQVFDGFVGEAVASMRRGAVEASIRASVSDSSVCIEGRVRGGRDVSW